MKILLSPSKTMDMRQTDKLTTTSILDPGKTKNILTHIQEMSKGALKQAMKVSDKLIEDIYPLYQNFDQQDQGHAIMSYTGFVFKKLNIDHYSIKDFQYLEDHVYILDALYGLLKPSTLIKPYRLDFTMNLGLDLYKKWDLSHYIQDDIVINLASNEYAKMIKNKKMITISFLQNKNNQFKNIATYTKQARGLFLDFMVNNQITSINQLRTFKEEDYRFNKDLSSQTELVFTR